MIIPRLHIEAALFVRIIASKQARAPEVEASFLLTKVLF